MSVKESEGKKDAFGLGEEAEEAFGELTEDEGYCVEDIDGLQIAYGDDRLGLKNRPVYWRRQNTIGTYRKAKRGEKTRLEKIAERTLEG